MRHMSNPTSPEEAVEAASLAPKKVAVDGQSVEEHSIKDLIEADRYLSAKRSTAAGGSHRGLRFTKLIPPGGG